MREFKQYQQSKYSEEDEQSPSEKSSEQEEQNEAMMNAEIERIQQQLKSMPYELILKQRKNDPNKQTGNSKKQANTPKIKKIAKKKHIVQNQKHEKNEAVQVSIYDKHRKKNAEIFEPKRKKTIDPRFESYAGHYNDDLAMKSYNFIPKLQQAEIDQLKRKLKNKSKRGKLTPHQRQVLTNQYNKVTSEHKRAQLIQLQRQTKRQLKQNHGEGFHIKKTVFKQEFERKKLSNLSQADREKKLRQKDNQMRRNQLNQRRKTLNINPKRFQAHK